MLIKKGPDLHVNIQQAFADRRALSVARAQSNPPILSVDSGYQFTTFTPVQPYHLFPGLVPNSPGCYLNLFPHGGAYILFITKAKRHKPQSNVVAKIFDQADQIQWQMSADIVTAYESVAVSTEASILPNFKKQVIPAAAQVARVSSS